MSGLMTVVHAVPVKTKHSSHKLVSSLSLWV